MKSKYATSGASKAARNLLRVSKYRTYNAGFLRKIGARRSSTKRVTMNHARGRPRRRVRREDTHPPWTSGNPRGALNRRVIPKPLTKKQNGVGEPTARQRLRSSPFQTKQTSAHAQPGRLLLQKWFSVLGQADVRCRIVRFRRKNRD